MTPTRLALLAALSLPLWTPTLTAQDPGGDAAATTAAAPRQALTAALTKTLATGTSSFSTTEDQDVALMRRMRAMTGAQETEVDGRWVGDLREASIGDDQIVVFVHGGRALVKGADGSYVRCRDSDHFGRPLPFVVEPKLLLESLLELEPDAAKLVDQAPSADGKRHTYGLTIDGKHAAALVLSGALPRTASPMLRLPGGLGRTAPAPLECTIDIAFDVDVETQLVQQIRTRIYKVDPMPEGVQFRIGSQDDTDEAADEADPKGANGEPIYRQGLRVRGEKKDVSKTTFEIRLKDHGKAADPKLDDAARRWLRL
jgi:hypothetical protein